MKPLQTHGRYEVRTGRDMRLVGYCRVNPIGWREFRVETIPERTFNEWARCEPIRTDEITLHVQQHEINGMWFTCWVVALRDVAKLLATTWLTFGGANRHQFVNAIKREMHEADLRAAQ